MNEVERKSVRRWKAGFVVALALVGTLAISSLWLFMRSNSFQIQVSDLEVENVSLQTKVSNLTSVRSSLQSRVDDLNKNITDLQSDACMHIMHIAIIWMSGKEGGIYAIGDVISDPQYIFDSETTTKYWMSDEDRGQKRLRVRIKYRLKLINNPIMKEELRNIPNLRNMSIFRQPQGTNFPVSDAEWKIISNLVKKRFSQ